MTWAGAILFDAGRFGGPTIQMDGEAAVAPNPFEALVAAVGACAAIDVVHILKKQRRPVASLEVRVEADRADSVPRRLKELRLNFTITGDGITRAQAERSVELSLTKYCSVRNSLAADIPVIWTIDL